MPRGLIFTTLSCTHSTVSLSPSPSYPFPRDHPPTGSHLTPLMAHQKLLLLLPNHIDSIFVPSLCFSTFQQQWLPSLFRNLSPSAATPLSPSAATSSPPHLSPPPWTEFGRLHEVVKREIWRAHSNWTPKVAVDGGGRTLTTVVARRRWTAVEGC